MSLTHNNVHIIKVESILIVRVYDIVGSKMVWVEKNLHRPNLSWYVKWMWATKIGVKGDLCNYAASQRHVSEGKATRFVIFLFMWPHPLLNMVGFIISFPKSCLRFLMNCVRVVYTCVPYSHAIVILLCFICLFSLRDFMKPFPIWGWP